MSAVRLEDVASEVGAMCFAHLENGYPGMHRLIVSEKI
jgi:hypothetical protein